MMSNEDDESQPILLEINEDPTNDDNAVTKYGATAASPAAVTGIQSEKTNKKDGGNTTPTPSSSQFGTFVRSVPAAVLIAMLNLMMAVPFGSAYFASPSIPLDGATKQALGMRLSLLAQAAGQFVMGTAGLSSFASLSVWQIGELSPFYQTLIGIAVQLSYYNHNEDAAANNNEQQQQQQQDESIIFPTTLYLISLSTLAVGLCFYVLGKFGLGQLTYFFPSHVLLGLVGGVGLWLGTLSISVSVSPSLLDSDGGSSDDLDGSSSTSEIENELLRSIVTVVRHPYHFGITVVFALGLRFLQSFVFTDKAKFVLLDPFYFLSIPAVFYAAMYSPVFGGGSLTLSDAISRGYFFANPDSGGGGGGFGTGVDDNNNSVWYDAFDIWRQFDVTKVRYDSIYYAAPTIVTCGLLGVMLNAPFMYVCVCACVSFFSLSSCVWFAAAASSSAKTGKKWREGSQQHYSNVVSFFSPLLLSVSVSLFLVMTLCYAQ